MNAELFYENFKTVLKFLEVEWGEKEKIDIKIKDNKLFFIKKDSIAEIILDINKI